MRCRKQKRGIRHAYVKDPSPSAHLRPYPQPRAADPHHERLTLIQPPDGPDDHELEDTQQQGHSRYKAYLRGLGFVRTVTVLVVTCILHIFTLLSKPESKPPNVHTILPTGTVFGSQPPIVPSVAAVLPISARLINARAVGARFGRSLPPAAHMYSCLDNLPMGLAHYR